MPCIMPISIRDKKRPGQTHAVPCGKCPQCKLRKVQSWVFRLRQEEKIHTSAIFATLTYDPQHVPVTAKGFMDLRKTDLQKFFKRLRKNTQRKSIKYYAVGEYGGKSWRPHYHAIIYDATDKEITQAWGLGGTHFGTVTEDSIAYTAKYMYKPKRVPLHANDDRISEFSLMSKNMGKNYLTPSIIKYYEDSQISHITLPGGYIQPLPRYYRDRLYTPEEREHINARSAPQHLELLKQAIQRAGGADNYFRNHHAMVTHELHKFNKQQNKRDAL